MMNLKTVLSANIDKVTGELNLASFSHSHSSHTVYLHSKYIISILSFKECWLKKNPTNTMNKINFAYVDTTNLKVFKEERIPDRTFRWSEYANITYRTLFSSFFFFFMVESSATPIKPLSKYLQNWGAAVIRWYSIAAGATSFPSHKGWESPLLSFSLLKT